tara:strand:+ start:759 stop:1028 length:270 start_codon:yes stop_codon:yes gene_type:complete
MSVTDMNEIANLVGEVVDCFEEQMRTVFEEEPEIFEGRSTELEWKSQVTNCGLDLVVAIDELIEKFEVKLHNGEYHREMRDWQRAAGIK